MSYSINTTLLTISDPSISQYAKDGTRRKGAVGDEPLHWPLQEGALAVSLEHAYHHPNFAWNGRFKTMREADAQFGPQ